MRGCTKSFIKRTNVYKRDCESAYMDYHFCIVCNFSCAYLNVQKWIIFQVSKNFPPSSSPASNDMEESRLFFGNEFAGEKCGRSTLIHLPTTDLDVVVVVVDE